jgi:chemotaxis receptor (MCP) glutamine deamidase CheD
MTKKIGRSNGLNGVPKANSVNFAAIIRKIKTNIKGFHVKGIRPIPEIRRPNHPVRLYHFNGDLLSVEPIEWGEHNMATSRSSKVAVKKDNVLILSDQLAVSETPVILDVSVGGCALVTLYDRQRKVGAAVHISARHMNIDFHKKLISLALYKMGVLKGDNLLNVEARILGAEWQVSGHKDMSLAWVEQIRSFLKDCSVQMLPDNVGKVVNIKFDLRDGHIEYYELQMGDLW